MIDVPIVCFSIETRHAEAIYRGEKPWEYRRQPPAVDPPYAALLYETSPRQRIHGAAWVDDEVDGPTEDVIHQTVEDTSHTVRELREYFYGADDGAALSIGRTRRFETGVHRTDVGVATAPQNFVYVDADDLPSSVERELEALAEAGAPDVEPAQASYRVHCPECGRSIGAASEYCKHCGSNVGPTIESAFQTNE